VKGNKSERRKKVVTIIIRRSFGWTARPKDRVVRCTVFAVAWNDEEDEGEETKVEQTNKRIRFGGYGLKRYPPKMLDSTIDERTEGNVVRTVHQVRRGTWINQAESCGIGRTRWYI
jgi:hypothetical protein